MQNIILETRFLFNKRPKNSTKFNFLFTNWCTYVISSSFITVITAATIMTTTYQTPSSTHESSSSQVTVSLNWFRLSSLDPSAIRVFLRNYDSYTQMIVARAKQLTKTSDSNMSSAEAILTVDIKYCVDAQMLSSTIALGFIKDVTDCDALTNAELRKFHYMESE